MSTPPCYRPTPLERAHATHLLFTYFDTPVNLYNDDGEMRVSGRVAVPFLTSSGVDRGLLRIIWSVADPDGVGTLTIRSQFHIILRLIAMAQAHFLPPLTPGTENQYASVLREALLSNSHLVMALPTFTSDINPPSVAHLLSKYPTPDHLHHAGDASVVDNSKDNISNMLTNHDLQYQMWQKQQLEQSNNSSKGVGDSISSSRQMSVDDAFGDLHEVEDLPLPTLQYTVPEEKQNNEDQVDEDDFGDFDAVQSGEITIANDGVNGFDGGPLTVQPQGSVVTAIEGPSNDAAEAFETPDDDNNEFNAYDSAPEIVDSTNIIVQETAFESIATPTNGTNTMFLGDPEIISDKNMNEAVDHTLSQPINHGHTLSISDAFETLVTDKGLSPDTFNNTTEQALDLGSTHISIGRTEDIEMVYEDDEFGGFESTQIHSEPAETSASNHVFQAESSNLSHLSQHGPTLSISDAFEPSALNQESASTLNINSDLKDETFSDFDERNGVGAHGHDIGNMATLSIEASEHEVSTATQSTHAPTLSISDAFDALVPDQDLNFSIGGANKQATNSENNTAGDEDEFGGFESTHAQSEFTETCNSDHDFHTEIIPSLYRSNNFQSSVPNQAMSASTGQTFENNTLNSNTELKDDAFGDFEESNDVELSVHTKDQVTKNMPLFVPDESDCVISTASPDTNAPSLLISNPVDALVPDHSEQAVEDSDKNVGVETTSVQTSLHNWNDTLRPIDKDNKEIYIADQDEKRKSEQDADLLHPTESSFENAEFSTNTLGNEVGGLSALDDIFGGIQDAPLPPLEAFSPTFDQGEKQGMEVLESKESFGNFEGNAMSTEDIQTDDDVISTNDLQLNALPQLAENSLTDLVEDDALNQMDESFGDFEAPSTTLEQKATDTYRTGDIANNDFGGFTTFDQTVPQPDFIPHSDDALDQVDESFCNFEAPSPPVEQTNADTNRTEDIAKDFGGFTTFHQTLPQPNCIPHPDDGFDLVDESFGDFEAPFTIEQTAADTYPTEDIAVVTNDVNNDDDFGGFTTFNHTVPPPECIPQHDDAFDQVDESFGDFEAPSTTLEQTAADTYQTEDIANDDFGGFTTFDQAVPQPECKSQHDDAFDQVDESFGDLEAPSPPVEQTDADTNRTEDIAEVTNQVNNADDFGGFTTFDQAVPAPECIPEPTTVPKDVNGIDYGHLESTARDAASKLFPSSVKGEDDDFGCFSAFGSETAEGMILPEHTQEEDQLALPNIESNVVVSTEAYEDDFGNFAEFVSNNTEDINNQDDSTTAPNKQLETVVMQNSDFGNFSTFESADDLIVSEETGKDTNDFGDFAAFGSAQSQETNNGSTSYRTAKDDVVVTQDDSIAPSNGHQSEKKVGAVEDDFGDFEAFSTGNEIDNASAEFGDSSELDSAPFSMELREAIRVLIQRLPPSLPPKGTLIECYDICSRRNESPKKQLHRCKLLCEILVEDESALCKKWETVISTINGDLERGQKILDFFATKLSSNDRSIILQSIKLSNHFLGLSEFVRITRYIMATLHDLLCLETDGTLPTYHKSIFITHIEAIDKSWSAISVKALDLGILSEAPPLKNAQEIRMRYLNCESTEQYELCQLTLQPLLSGENQGTSSTVTKDGKQYMACAANFLAHR